MDLFEFMRWVLIISLSINFFPINIPLAAMAYKIRLGNAKLPMDTDVFWWRSTGVALGLFGLSLVTMVLDFLAVSIDFPPGLVHIVLFLLYLPAAVWYVFWMFALDDILEGFSLLMIYTWLPGLILALLVTFGFHLPVLPAESMIQPNTQEIF